MLRMPTHHVTETAKRNLDRFRATSAASEFDDDPRTWVVAQWSWGEGPPLSVRLRSDDGEVLDFVMDESGSWRLRREPTALRP
jgi:hypothetical protein